MKTPIPQKTPIEMIRILPDDEFTKAGMFVELGAELKCKPNIRYAHANKYWRCVFSRKNPSRVLFTVECTEEWWRAKACLWNIDSYLDSFLACSDNIKNIIINAYDCKSCNNHCSGGAQFTHENQQYRKCVGCCFYFCDLSGNDWKDLLMLIEKEHEASSSR